MERTRKAVEEFAAACFPGRDVAPLLAILDGYGSRPWHNERERVHLAILRLSAGDEEKLRRYVAMADTDYRDVLVAAEYPPPSAEQVKADRARAEEILRKWGKKA